MGDKGVSQHAPSLFFFFILQWTAHTFEPTVFLSTLAAALKRNEGNTHVKMRSFSYYWSVISVLFRWRHFSRCASRTSNESLLLDCTRLSTLPPTSRALFKTTDNNKAFFFYLASHPITYITGLGSSATAEKSDA